MKNKKIYYKDLDIIRVLSCILVLLYHLNILKGGYLAVCIFFVLSGYLSIISAFRKEKFSILSYYKERFIHIYIPLLIVVFITLGVIALIPSINWLTLKPETTSVLLGYNNFWQLTANMDYFARHVSSPFMHFWYIGILLQFELVFPFIFYILKLLGEKIRKWVPIVLMMLLSFGGYAYFLYSSLNDNIMVTYYDTFVRSFSILFGLTAGLIKVYFKNTKTCLTNKVTNRIVFYLYLLITVLLCIFIPSTSPYFNAVMLIITFIGCRLIDYGTSLSKDNLNICDKSIKSFAKITYEIYLVQYPVIFLFQDLEMNNILRIICIIVITIVLSYILHFSLDYKKNGEGKVKLKVMKIITLVLLSLFSAFGIYNYVISKDHTEEMKALEEQLNKNEELMEVKQKEYEASLKEEQDNWNSVLADLESGEEKIKEVIDKMPVVSIGDSVMLGAAQSLYKVFPKGYVDAKVSRADCEVPGILRSIKNKIGEVVVIGLGTNGSCGNGTRNEIINILKDKKVFILTVTNDRQVHMNSHIRSLAKNNSNVYLIDWEEISKGHREYFGADLIHLTGIGQTAYSNAIYNAIYKVYLDEFNEKKNGIINEHEKEMKEKITFYGNDLIINAFDDIKENFLKTDFKLDKDYDFEKLLNDIKNGIANKTINHRIVFAFDKQASISKDNYLEILSILADYEVYIVSFDNKLEINNENVKVIDFNSELTNHPEYIMADRIHMTKEANKVLGDMLDKVVNNK